MELINQTNKLTQFIVYNGIQHSTKKHTIIERFCVALTSRFCACEFRSLSICDSLPLVAVDAWLFVLLRHEACVDTLIDADEVLLIYNN